MLLNHFQKYLSTVNSPVLLYLRKLLIDYRVVTVQSSEMHVELPFFPCNINSLHCLWRSDCLGFDLYQLLLGYYSLLVLYYPETVSCVRYSSFSLAYSLRIHSFFFKNGRVADTQTIKCKCMVHGCVEQVLLCLKMCKTCCFELHTSKNECFSAPYLVHFTRRSPVEVIRYDNSSWMSLKMQISNLKKAHWCDCTPCKVKGNIILGCVCTSALIIIIICVYVLICLSFYPCCMLFSSLG